MLINFLEGNMKRLIAVILTLMICVSLASCSESKSIGIIGGADGETNIYVSEK